MTTTTDIIETLSVENILRAYREADDSQMARGMA